MEHFKRILSSFPLLIIILVSHGVFSDTKICSDSAASCQPGEICSSDGFCTCPGSPILKQVYDDFEQKCVFLVGENCETNQDCISSSTCHPEWDSEFHRFQGKCRCASGNYFENLTTGTCEDRAEFGQICNELVPCQISHLLTCHPTQGTCQCIDDKTQIYDQFKRSCVLKLGENCYDHRRHFQAICPQNAECIFFFKKRNTPRCKCIKGFIQNSEGFCRAGFEIKCNSTSPCLESSGLICSDGTCQCDSPLTQIFNEKQKECVRIAGSYCNLTSQCVPHASCHEGSCRCEFGYSKNSQGICLLDNGESCGSGHGLACNSDAGLACRDGICKCIDSQRLIYDSETKVCRLSSLTMNTNAETRLAKMMVCGLKENIVSKISYSIRCPKGYECIRESPDLGCSCGFRGHPHHRRDEFCLRDHL